MKLNKKQIIEWGTPRKIFRVNITERDFQDRVSIAHRSLTIYDNTQKLTISQVKQMVSDFLFKKAEEKVSKRTRKRILGIFKK